MVRVRPRLAALLTALVVVAPVALAPNASRAADATFKPPASRPDATALNVILFIGDGMGREQVKAGSLFATGKPDGLSFHALPHHATVVTDSATPDVPTDSAASATALATGVKVNNGVVSMRIPGSTDDLPTIAELMKRRGAAVGFVTTDSIVGATPAAFFSHAPARQAWKKISRDYAEAVKPDVMLGAGYPGLKPQVFEAAGYTMLADAAAVKAEIKRLDSGEAARPICGLFTGDRFPYLYHDEADQSKLYGAAYPKLPDMTKAAIAALAKRGGDSGFFLIVESALVDKSGHGERVRNLTDDRTNVSVRETAALSKAVAVAVEWAGKQDAPTLIIVTADHETGGMAIVEPRGKGEAPRCTWEHKSHTRADVDVWTNGVGAGADVSGQIDNTAIFRLMAKAAGVEADAAPPASEADRVKQPADAAPPVPAPIDAD